MDFPLWKNLFWELLFRVEENLLQWTACLFSSLTLSLFFKRTFITYETCQFKENGCKIYCCIYLKLYDLITLKTRLSRCGFRLPQRSHLRKLKNFVGEKSGKRFWKIGETLDKIGKLGNFEEVHFFPVSAPVLDMVSKCCAISFCRYGFGYVEYHWNS